MGRDINEGAQSMYAFVVAFMSSLALQCQLCTHQTATTADERVMGWCEGFCSEVSEVISVTGEEDRSSQMVMALLPNEATAGYGPMRSRVSRALSGLSFERVV